MLIRIYDKTSCLLSYNSMKNQKMLGTPNFMRCQQENLLIKTFSGW